MTLRAGFAQVDITPSVGGYKLSWSHPIVIDRIVEPIFAHVAVLDDGRRRAALVSHDLCWTPRRLTEHVRQRTADCLPGGDLILGATHNHAAPGFTDDRPIQTTVPYTVEFVGPRLVSAIREACGALAPVEACVASGVEGRVSFIRRCLMKDGSVKSQPRPGDPNIRCVESPIDPELGVIALRSPGGAMRGLVVNFALHPTQFGGDQTVQRGWPGRMVDRVRQRLGQSCGVVFLNGAFGDVHAQNRLDPTVDEDVDRIGRTLADRVVDLAEHGEYRHAMHVGASKACVALPFRDPDKVYGPHQMFLAPDVVAAARQRFDAWRAGRDAYELELQAVTLGGEQAAFISVGCELFTRLGIEIKQDSPFDYSFIVGNGNDSIGYMPFPDAVARGGYECTFPASRFAPEAGRRLVDAAVCLLCDAADA